MCGIVAGANIGDNKKENVNEWIINQYQDQYSRGQQGFGSIMVQENGNYEIHRACENTKAILDLYMNEAPFIIFHHRYPTSSENKISQTHPIKVDNGSLKYKYLIVHNGVISNDNEIREKHMSQLGFTYETDRTPSNSYKEFEFNDSETVAIEFARFIEKQTDKIETIGAAAIIALQIDKKTDKVKQLYFTRHLNPLNMSKSNKKIRLSSEGEGESLKEDIMYSCNIKDWKLHKTKIKFQERKYEPKTETIQSLVPETTKEKTKRLYSMEDWDRTYGDNYEYSPNEAALETFNEQIEELLEEIVTEASDPETALWLEPKHYEPKLTEAFKEMINTIKENAEETMEKLTDPKTDTMSQKTHLPL